MLLGRPGVDDPIYMSEESMVRPLSCSGIIEAAAAADDDDDDDDDNDDGNDDDEYMHILYSDVTISPQVAVTSIYPEMDFFPFLPLC